MAYICQIERLEQVAITRTFQANAVWGTWRQQKICQIDAVFISNKVEIVEDGSSTVQS